MALLPAALLVQSAVWQQCDHRRRRPRFPVRMPTKTETGGSMTTQQPWPWPEEMDALVAAPGSHHVLLENDRVRVLEVMIEPGVREPEHTHRAASLMIIDEPTRIRYYAEGELRLEIQRGLSGQVQVQVRWLEPEGPHSVENVDQRRYHAVRVELK
jgi:quercetin dioxygenase-like cupin family protein